MYDEQIILPIHFFAILLHPYKSVALLRYIECNQINASESLANTSRALYWTHRISFGCSLSAALNALPARENTEHEQQQVQSLFETFASAGCRYCVLPGGVSGEMSVLLTPSAQPVSESCEQHN
jgi:hypothetical protein